MTRAHDAVIVARLRIDELVNCVYYDEKIPVKDTSGKPFTKYLRVRTGTGLIHAARLTGPLGARRKTYWLTGVGNTPMQAAWVLEQATDVLLNWTPTVPGWTCRRLEFAASQPVGEDPEVDGRFFGVDQWDLVSEPTA